MCGIAGIISHKKSRGALDTEVRTMIETLLHRGPDGSGVWINGTHDLALAHRRLAIQDLTDRGSQPMLSATGRYCVVFNGEIYNFKEIAASLARRGHQFHGQSDTEVLLAALEEWGIESAIKSFIGMFAFALWDNRKRTLYLCRDRIGEKPLYYGWLGTDFYFASELRAIEKVAPAASLELDTTALADYFRYGYISAPYSIYRSIYKLPPATILALPVESNISPSQLTPFPDTSFYSPKTYWSLSDIISQRDSNIITDTNEAVDELDKLLHLTVRRQMIADVSIGMFLSGGIDSTLVSAIAQQESRERVRTFTIGFSEKEYDETRYAEAIAKHLDTEHLTVNVSPQDSMQVIPDLASIYDEPFADSSQIPAYLVSKLAREHVSVCLSGDGGDELFAGYNRYLYLSSIWKMIGPVPPPVRKILGRMLSIPPPGFWNSLYGKLSIIRGRDAEKQKLIGLKLQKLAGLIQQQDLMRGYEYLLSYWHNPQDLVLMGEDTVAKYPDGNLPKTTDFIETAMYLDQLGYLPGDNLVKVDRASMAVSLETRLPLLSHELLELSWRIPVSMKVRDNSSKWILRKVLSRYVPDHLFERPKMGFSVPIADWLRGDLKEWAEDLLFTGKTGGYEYIRDKPVRIAWKEHLSGKRDHSHRLWTVLMFLSWMNSRKYTS